jgi:ATP-dependent DNA ligase
MFAGAMALGLEGVVAKDAKSPYVEGPTLTWHWQKMKNRVYQRKEKVEFNPPRRTGSGRSKKALGDIS